MDGYVHRPVSPRRPARLPWLLGAWLWLAAPIACALPDGFVYLDEAVPQAVGEARYAGSDNFVGAPVDGYRAPRVVLSQPAAHALRQACATLAPFGLGLKVFDGYRPQRAVDQFMRWAADARDTRTQAAHYPGLAKERLIPDGYIARRSGHSRGSSVDLTLIDLADGSELPMGTPFDFFGQPSWPDYRALSPAIRANRALLQQVMVRSGFRPLKQEWWHFTLEREPWPDRYFDFPVE
jgi:D-alanyl-D-alanine dipeptidase